MGKVFRAAVLVAALGALVSAGSMTTSSPAQEKTTAIQKDKIGTIEVYKAKDGWRFRVKNNEGKSVAIGTVGYDTKEEAVKIVDFVKNTFAKGTVDVLKEPAKDKDK
jgi:uncharacterized protein YegP (UPF0339 family)